MLSQTERAVLHGDESHSNEVQRRQAYRQPQEYTLQQRAPTHFFQCGAGDAAADEEERGGKSQPAQREERRGNARKGRNVRIGDRGEQEKEDEPGELNAGTVVLDGRGSEGQRHDPKRAREFNGGANDQCLRAVFRGGADHGTSVVNRERGPQAELRLREMQCASDRGKNQQRHGVQNENGAERDGHFFFIGLQYGSHRSDGAAAANRRARRDQKRGIAADPQEFSERESQQQREGDSDRGVKKTAAPRFQDFVQVHAEPKSHDGALQKCAGDSPALVDIRMRKTEAKENSERERDRRRNVSGKGKEETGDKKNFRKGGHRPEREYQAGNRLGQQ